VAAGEVFSGEVELELCADCSRLAAAAAADAVVMQEDTRLDAAQSSTVLFLDAAKALENVRFRGEDLKCGAALGEAGDELTAGRLSFAGRRRADSRFRGTTSGGWFAGQRFELIEAGQPLEPGKNLREQSLGLATLAAQAGAIPKIYHW